MSYGSDEAPWAQPSEAAYGWRPPTQPGPPNGYDTGPPIYPYGPEPYLVADADYPPYPYDPGGRSSTGPKIFVVVLTVALVAALGTITYLLFGSKTTAQPTKLAIASVSATPPRSGLDQFTLPASVDGLPTSTSQTMADLTRYMTDSMMEKGGTPAVARVYQRSGDGSDLFVLAGISTVMVDPSSQIRDLITGLRAQTQFALGKPVSYSPGTLGGSLTCVSGRLSATGRTLPVGICLLADAGGMIVAMYFTHSTAVTAKVVKEIRPQFEH